MECIKDKLAMILALLLLLTPCCGWVLCVDSVRGPAYEPSVDGCRCCQATRHHTDEEHHQHRCVYSSRGAHGSRESGACVDLVSSLLDRLVPPDAVWLPTVPVCVVVLENAFAEQVLTRKIFWHIYPPPDPVGVDCCGLILTRIVCLLL